MVSVRISFLEGAQSPSETWHVVNLDTLRTLCGVDLDVARSGPEKEWASTSLGTFVDPPWGQRCRKCYRAYARIKTNWPPR